jgi:hypothetical protein
LLIGMTSISLHMQWPLTSQLRGSVSQREQLVFHYGSNSTPCLQNLPISAFVSLIPMPNLFLQIPQLPAQRNRVEGGRGLPVPRLQRRQRPVGLLDRKGGRTLQAGGPDWANFLSNEFPKL